MGKWMLVAVLALAGGCAGVGVTPAEKEALVQKAGQVAFEKVFDAAVKQGLSVEAAREVALLAQREAEDLAREKIPVESKSGSAFAQIFGTILTLILPMIGKKGLSS